MPTPKKPASYSTWSPKRQKAYDELEQMRREMAAEEAAANEKRAIPGTERRRPQQQTQQRPAKPAATTPSKPAAPTVQGTIRTMQGYQDRLNQYSGGGPVKKKKAVAKKVMAKGVAKKATAKGVAKRGMGRAMMRGR